MATLQDVAQGLGTGDVQAMAKALGLNPPISLLALIRAFVQAAQPKIPVILSPSGNNVPLTGPVWLRWLDPGVGNFWRALAFWVQLEQFVDDPNLPLESLLGPAPVSGTEMAIGPGSLSPDILKHNTRYLLKIYAVNTYGTSGTAQAEFHTVS